VYQVAIVWRQYPFSFFKTVERGVVYYGPQPPDELLTMYLILKYLARKVKEEYREKYVEVDVVAVPPRFLVVKSGKEVIDSFVVEVETEDGVEFVAKLKSIEEAVATEEKSISQNS
jgi:hypothetical protein